MAEKLLFVDRDGTLIDEPPDEQVDRIDKIRLMPGVIPALLALTRAGYRFVIVSNQDGLGTDAFPTDRFEAPQSFMTALFESQGIVFADALFCPHVETDRCGCRKPRTGLLTRLLASTDLDTGASAVVGDRDTDLELAANLGLRGFRVRAGGEPGETWDDVVRALTAGSRVAEIRRKTNETDIVVRVDLDSDGPATISTGIGFFDHMLEQVARHGGFALQLSCRGDLDVDEHHTIEDTALTLGRALRRALGDKRGIGRFGFVVPMDETRAQVALDLCDRPYSVFEADLRRDRVGGLATEMVPHFFRSLADGLGATLHIAVTGENTHHQIEAAFKGLGRALRQAIAVEGTGVPSTKGVL